MLALFGSLKRANIGIREADDVELSLSQEKNGKPLHGKRTSRVSDWRLGLACLHFRLGFHVSRRGQATRYRADTRERAMVGRKNEWCQFRVGNESRAPLPSTPRNRHIDKENKAPAVTLGARDSKQRRSDAKDNPHMTDLHQKGMQSSTQKA